MPAWGPFPRTLVAQGPGGRRSACLGRGRQSRLCDGFPKDKDRAGRRRGAKTTSPVSTEGGG
eukprot:6606784-Alexandrium_andersonii.AAC.1